MATGVSSSDTRAQIKIVCQICETESKIKYKCLDCNHLMCEKCRTTIHPKFSEDHEIVDLSDVGQINANFQPRTNLTYITCDKHKNQKCYLYCNTCDSLVCVSCISTDHTGHEFLQISHGLQIKTDMLQGNITSAENELRELKDEKYKLETFQEKQKLKYEEVCQDILKQESVIKKQIEEQIKNKSDEIKRRWLILENRVKDRLQSIRNREDKIIKTKNDTEHKIQSKDIRKYFIKDSTVDLKPDQSLYMFNYDPLPGYVPNNQCLCELGKFESENDIPNLKSKGNEYIAGLFPSCEILSYFPDVTSVSVQP